MKRLISVILAITLIFCLPLGAAAKFETEMNTLGDLFMFLGDNNGFNGDRTATRMEACVMMTRLLGAEQTALAGTGECVFTDVPEWAKPYAAYLSAQGIVHGTNETTFSPDLLCTTQMMSALLLRAAGATDFDYAQALDAAYEKGIADSTQNYEITRGEMARMSYNALVGAGLAEALINDGRLNGEEYAAALEANDLEKNLEEFRDAFGRYAVTLEGQLAISCTAKGVTAEETASHYLSLSWDSNAVIKKLYSLTEVIKPINIGGTSEDFLQTVEQTLVGDTLLTTVKSRGESYSYSREYKQSLGADGEFSSGRKTVSGDYAVYTFTLCGDYARTLSVDTAGTDVTEASGKATLYVRDGVAERYCLDIELEDSRAQYRINADYLIIEIDETRV